MMCGQNKPHPNLLIVVAIDVWWVSMVLAVRYGFVGVILLIPDPLSFSPYFLDIIQLPPRL